MLEASVDRLGRPVGGTRMIEVGQDVGGSFGLGRDLVQSGRDACFRELMSCCIRCLPKAWVPLRGSPASGAGRGPGALDPVA